MKAYATFQRRMNPTWDGEQWVIFIPELTDILGSDGVLPLDGRLSLDSMKAQCQMVMDNRNKVRSTDICGYKIFRGSRFYEGSLIYEWARSGWDAYRIDYKTKTLW